MAVICILAFKTRVLRSFIYSLWLRCRNLPHLQGAKTCCRRGRFNTCKTLPRAAKSQLAARRRCLNKKVSDFALKVSIRQTEVQINIWTYQIICQCVTAEVCGWLLWFVDTRPWLRCVYVYFDLQASPQPLHTLLPYWHRVFHSWHSQLE